MKKNYGNKFFNPIFFDVCSELCPHTKSLYIELCTLFDAFEKVVHGHETVSMAVLCKLAGSDRRRTTKHINKLAKHGLIKASTQTEGEMFDITML